MIKNKTIVFISTMEFSDLPTRKQRLANRLSTDNIVVYFEPPNTYLAKVFKRKNKKNIPFREVSKNLFVDKLPDVLPFGLRFFPFQESNQKRIVSYIKNMLIKNNLTPDLLWFYLVDYPGITYAFIDSTVVYDCVDDHSAYGGLRKPDFVNNLEKELVENSEVLFTTTNELSDKLEKFGGVPLVIPNGVDYPLFERWNGEKPEILKNEKRKIIGYFGALQKWFDVDFIKEAAKKFSNNLFVLAGPCSEGFKNEFSEFSNILFPGKIKYEDAPAWIGSFDVCTIPFIQNNLTLNISPLKFFEYCSLGKPCLTIPIKQLNLYDGISYIYQNHEEGLSKLSLALKEDNAEYRKERIAIAKREAWEEKFDFMFQQVERFFD
ncbi:MAG: glycosyltransferase [Caldisericia bacterium]|nr:glycosyltransferase [Caldisericia bacterium]